MASSPAQPVDQAEALAIRRALQQDHLAVEPLAGLAAAAFACGETARARAIAGEVRAIEQAGELQGILHPQAIRDLCRGLLGL